MVLGSHIVHFDWQDGVAAALFILAWLGSGWIIERKRARRLSVSVLMNAYRHDWMREFVTRQPRIFDATIMESLRQGTSFFASACMIAIGGGLALMGNTDRLAGLAEDLTLSTGPAVVFEVKLIAALLLVSNAFLKFVWAHRLFGYCAILMAAVPNEPHDPGAYPRAAQAAEVNISAAKNFNRGLRSVYFALAALAWLLGPLPLIAATVVTLAVLWRREFASASRQALLQRAG